MVLVITQSVNFTIDFILKLFHKIKIPFIRINIDDLIGCVSDVRIETENDICIINGTTLNDLMINRIPSVNFYIHIIFFNSSENKTTFSTSNFTVNGTNRKLSVSKSCGHVFRSKSQLNNQYINNNFRLNSCLSSKISIDASGNIKNCPSMNESFGNIKDTTLAEAIEKPGFKKYWSINKDKIHVCKDCEFRYICTDCRAYVEDPDDILSKPLKCGYNPYTGEWSEWSDNPLKQKAIDFYGMREMVEETNDKL